jgi:hypothetical protein
MFRYSIKLIIFAPDIITNMETKEVNIKTGKPFIIANPLYDTVFKKLMENQRIAKFFISTILEQQVEDLSVLQQEFSYKLDSTKVSEKRAKKRKQEEVTYYTIFRLDFVATVVTGDGKRHRILIELQKSWDTEDVIRFRQYLGEQYKRVETIDGKKTILPITTIYILGNNIAEESPCVKVGRTRTDMRNKKPIDTKSEFIESLTHDSYVIQANRITDVRYITNLDKLLSIFEQKYFIAEDSDVRKEYPYQPDDENIKLITDVLYEMGADPEKRKEIEDEEEALRTIIDMQESKTEPLKKEIAELKGENAGLKEKLAEMERLLRDNKNKEKS